MNKDEILFLSSEYTLLKNKSPLSIEDGVRIQELEKILLDYILLANASSLIDNTRLVLIIDDDGYLTYKLPNQVSDIQKQFFVNSHLISNPSWFLKLVLLLEALFTRFLHNND